MTPMTIAVAIASAATGWAAGQDTSHADSNKQWEQADEFDEVTVHFTITARKRWIRQLLGMFKTMQEFGSLGTSRVLGFYSDGDGDFRPKVAVNGQDLWNKEFGKWTQWGQESANRITTLPESRPKAEFFFHAG